MQYYASLLPWAHEYAHAEAELAAIRRRLERPKVDLGSFGMGKTSMLIYWLNLADKHVLTTQAKSCDNCRRGHSLEHLLADYQRKFVSFASFRLASLITRRDLLWEPARERVRNDEYTDVILTASDLPVFSTRRDHICTMPRVQLLRMQCPDGGEMLFRFLSSILKILHLLVAVILAHLCHIAEALTFGLVVIAALLRYGHRHDSDDDLRLPLLRRYFNSVGRVSVV